jgi:electron transport complex protein RnfC
LSAIDFLCYKAFVKMKLRAQRGRVMSADSILVMSCCIGVQVVSAVVDKVAHPACNTISLGGAQGEWPGSERFLKCGDCLLDWKGGICPLTACTKGLLNGPCGGSKDGRCEFEPEERECGWHLIYELIKKLGRLDKLREAPPIIKNYAKSQPPRSLRDTTFWAFQILTPNAPRTPICVNLVALTPRSLS